MLAVEYLPVFRCHLYCVISAELSLSSMTYIHLTLLAGIQGRNYRSTTVGGGASNFTKEDEFHRNNITDLSLPPPRSKTNQYTTCPPPQTAFVKLTDYPKHSPVHVSVPNPAFSPKRAAADPESHYPPKPPSFGVETHYPPKRTSLDTTSPHHTPYGSPYRVPGPAPRVDPNIKSNIRREEALSNHERVAYGPNILARAPSVDASRKASRLPNGHLERTIPVSYSPSREFVQIHDSELGCSSC